MTVLSVYALTKVDCSYKTLCYLHGYTYAETFYLFFLSDEGSIDVKEGNLSGHNCVNLQQNIKKIRLNLHVSDFNQLVL